MAKFLSLILAIVSVPTCLEALFWGTESQGPVVKSKYGKVRGTNVVWRDKELRLFLGVPYAKPPVGPLRFELPQPPEPWTDTRDAIEPPPACYQGYFRHAPPPAKKSEDCLYLNIYAPEVNTQDTKLPVLAFIHGGYFMVGASTNDLYNATVLSAAGNVIVVSINYRLAALGFAFTGHTKDDIRGNLGLWDQNMALRWVYENIANFGGDPKRITLFGESAGAYSVSSHVVSKQSNRMIKGAIMESGGVFGPLKTCPEKAAETTRKFAQEFGCNVKDDRKIKACLKKIPSEKLFEKWQKPGPNPQLSAVVYGDHPDPKQAFFPVNQAQMMEEGSFPTWINLLIGVTSNEGATFLMVSDPVTFNPIMPMTFTKEQAFKQLESNSFDNDTELLEMGKDYYLKPVSEYDHIGLRDALAMYIGDHFMNCPTEDFGVEFAKTQARRNGGNVYAFIVNQTARYTMVPICPTSPWMQSCHGDDLPFVFGLPYLMPDMYSDDDRRLAGKVVEAWTTFAREGHPGTINLNSKLEENIEITYTRWHSYWLKYLSGALDNLVTKLIGSWRPPLPYIGREAEVPWPAWKSDGRDFNEYWVELRATGASQGSPFHVQVNPYKERCQHKFKKFIQFC